MLRVGITGGIGSGKTTVCSIFEKLGVPVYYADLKAKELVNTNLDLQNQITNAFGQNSFIEGAYNRAFIASIVFSDKRKLELLNSIIHPFVLNDWEDYCKQHANFPYVVKEAAIMLETDSKNSIDTVVLVHAPLELRIQWIQERDHASKSEIEARINAQMSEDEKMKLADYIVYNDQKHSLIEQVYTLHQKFTLSQLI
jgi:dephospho-CoA kinase